MRLLFVPLLLVLPAVVSLQNLQRIELGYPVAWDGDKYKNVRCQSEGIPTFIDGYLLCQVSASYGNSSNPNGQKLTHLIDAIGAIASFHIAAGQVFFSAAYYPARPYKIWEYYDRNFSKSSVPWSGWSDYNVTAMKRWQQVPVNPDAVDFHPSLDFWRIGSRVVAGTEAPDWVGLTFDVHTLSHFARVNFTEENDVFGRTDSDIVPITMPIHARQDKNGVIWGAAVTMSFPTKHFYHVIFTVDSQGVRRIVARHDYGSWNPAKCNRKFQYTGDKTKLPGYMHSIVSTEHYVVLPVTSLVINPCKFRPPAVKKGSHIQDGGMWGMDFYPQVPMRFLVFNKRTRLFMSVAPLTVHPAMWVSHQLNAYEIDQAMLVADMVVYDNHDPYAKFFYTNYLKRRLYPNAARFLRFTIDLKGYRAKYEYLLPQETISAEFPDINSDYEGRMYEWSYAVLNPFSAGSSIIKINVKDPTGGHNSQYRAGHTIVLHEPVFVARPNAESEDDGVLLIKGLDTKLERGLLIVVDALTMKQIGWAMAPTVIPFGFHNRFFSKEELNLPSGLPNHLTTTTTTTTTTPATLAPTTTKMTTPPPLPPRTWVPIAERTTRTPWVQPSIASYRPWPPRTTRRLPTMGPLIEATPMTRFTVRPSSRPTTQTPPGSRWVWTTVRTPTTTKRWTWQPRRRAKTTTTLPPEIRTPVTPSETTITSSTLPPEIQTPITPLPTSYRPPVRPATTRRYTARPWRPYPFVDTTQIPYARPSKSPGAAYPDETEVAPGAENVDYPDFTYIPPVPPSRPPPHQRGTEVDVQVEELYREMARALCEWMPAVFRRLKNVCIELDSQSPGTGGYAYRQRPPPAEEKVDDGGGGSQLLGGSNFAISDLNRLVASLTKEDLKQIEADYRRQITFAQPRAAAEHRLPNPFDSIVRRRRRLL